MPQPPIKPIWAGGKDPNNPGKAPGLDPKRGYRFILFLDGVPSYFVISSTVPGYTVGEGGTHKFLGHEFRFPGAVVWSKTIEVKLVDTIDYNMSQKLLDYIRKAGYVYPSNFSESQTNPEYYRRTISKAKFPFGQVKIQRLDSEGKVFESWVLNNPWISKADFGDADYTKEGLLNIGVTFTYDWAELRNEEDAVPPFPV